MKLIFMYTHTIDVDFFGVTITIPEKFKNGYLAMNDGGTVFAFINRPNNYSGHWFVGDGDVITAAHVETDLDWKKTILYIRDSVIKKV